MAKSTVHRTATGIVAQLTAIDLTREPLNGTERNATRELMIRMKHFSAARSTQGENLDIETSVEVRAFSSHQA